MNLVQISDLPERAQSRWIPYRSKPLTMHCQVIYSKTTPT